MAGRTFHSVLIVSGQSLLALAGLAALFAQPPAEGDMLVVPLASRTAGEVADFVSERGFRIVAAGDWPGSLVVRGERARLGWALRDQGLLVLASGPQGCKTL